MDYELTCDYSTSKSGPTAEHMNALLSDFTDCEHTDIQTTLSQLASNQRVWHWVIINSQQYSATVNFAKHQFSIIRITLDKSAPSKSTYPKMVKSVVAQLANSSRTKLILLVINNDAYRERLKSRFIRNASRQLKDRFIDLRFTHQVRSDSENLLLEKSYSITVSEKSNSQSPNTASPKSYQTPSHSLGALLNLITQIRSSINSTTSNYFRNDSDIAYSEKILNLLSDCAQCDIRMYKESHIANVINQLASDLDIHSIESLFHYLEPNIEHQENLIRRLSESPSTSENLLLHLKDTLLDSIETLQEWAYLNNNELRVWIPNFREYSLIKEIALIIHSAISGIDKNISLKIFASDSDPSRINLAQLIKSADTDLSNCTIILAHHNPRKQAPFANVHILFILNFMSLLNLNYANNLYSMYHFSMVSNGILLSDDNLTEDANRYFSKINSSNYFINIKKSHRIQHPLLSALLRRPVKMAVAPQSIRKLTQGLNKNYQAAFLNKILEVRAESLFVINDTLQITHFYGVDHHLTNPYSSGHFTITIDRLVGADYANKIRDALQILQDQGLLTIKVNPPPDFSNQLLIELSTFNSAYGEPPSNAHRQRKDSLYFVSIKSAIERPTHSTAPPQNQTYRAQQLEHQISDLNQQISQQMQSLVAAKVQLYDTIEKLTQATDENSQLKAQLKDVGIELKKLNSSQRTLASSLRQDAALKENLLFSLKILVIICDFNKNEFSCFGEYQHLLGTIKSSTSIEQFFCKYLPNIFDTAKNVAIDGKERFKMIFIRAQCFRLTIAPIPEAFRLQGDNTYNYRVTLSFHSHQAFEPSPNTAD